MATVSTRRVFASCVVAIGISLTAITTQSAAFSEPILGAPLSKLHLGMHLHALAVVGKGPTVIFATHGATVISHDGGHSFATIPQLAGLDGMEVAAGKAGRVIAVGGHNGALISHDGGSSWKNLSAHLPGKDTHGLGVDASDPNRIFAYVVGAGAFETRDGGATWTKLAQPPNEPMGTATIDSRTIMIPAMMPDMNMTGILRSTDDGKHWFLIDRNVSGMSLSDDPQRTRVVYLSGMGVLYVSRDAGRTWATRPLPATAEVVAPAADGSLYAAGYPNEHGVLWRSRDGGATWKRISS